MTSQITCPKCRGEGSIVTVREIRTRSGDEEEKIDCVECDECGGTGRKDGELDDDDRTRVG